MAGVAKEDIGLIVVATTTTTHAFPSAACSVQQMLGIKDCAAFDLAAACAGFTYALSVADQYVKNGAVKHALVIGADVLSRTLDPEDRGTIILFGDGAGAVVLGASEAPGILSTHLHADGSYGNLLTLPYKDRQNQDKPAYVTMAGNEVFKVAVTELARIVDETLQANNMDRSELDWLVPHGPTCASSAQRRKTGHGNGQSGGDARSSRQHLCRLGAFRTGRSRARRANSAWPTGAAGGLRRRLYTGLGAGSFLIWTGRKMTQFAFVFPGGVTDRWHAGRIGRTVPDR